MTPPQDQQSSGNQQSDRKCPEPLSGNKSIAPLQPELELKSGTASAQAKACPAECAENLIGATIDRRFKVLSRLGQSGMSEVYKAEHVIMQKPCAIKVLPPQQADSKNSIARFQQEAQAVSALNHPNIVKVYAFGLSKNNRLYLVLEYLDGPSLAKILATEGHLDWSRAVALLLQIADGMGHAHSRGIIHRDLKPSNIIIQTDENTSENARIVDFGIARLTGEANKTNGRLTSQGNICGSPPYMSPEQCRGENTDARSDIYSFGCLMYEMLSGRSPFTADTILELMQMHIEKQPELFQSFCPQLNIPPSLEALVRKCLNKNPDYRYQTMSELQIDLKSIGSDSPAEKQLQNSLHQELCTSGQKKSHKKTPAVKILSGALGASLLAAAVCVLFFYCGQLEINQLNSEIKNIPANDPGRIEKCFSIIQKLIACQAKTAPLPGMDRSDQEIVLSRLHDLQTEISARPLSLNRCFYQSALVRLYHRINKSGAVRDLSNETLADLERFISTETAGAHPRHNLIEAALQESISLCRAETNKRDRLVEHTYEHVCE